MISRVPKTSVVLMTTVYRRIFPEVNKELSYWKSRAMEIPNQELRSQALASISEKRFHCQGGAVYAMLAGDRWREAIQFIVAYQTISDFLDNLCDRSTSLDPKDFALLHQAMNDALTPGSQLKNYYALREDQADANYLTDLVQSCQKILVKLEDYSYIQTFLLQLETMYEDLQIHKHVKEEERVPRLTSWFDLHKEKVHGLSWYEFSAAAGSTLGIFCLVGYSFGGKMTNELARSIYDSYFPYMQGLHILLDYYIDQQEDIMEADLNFCSYYPNHDKMKARLIYFIEETDKQVKKLPDSKFHQMVLHGLVGLYLGDSKVKHIEGSREVIKKMLKESGYKARFFHWNIKLYYKIKPG